MTGFGQKAMKLMKKEKKTMLGFTNYDIKMNI